MKIFDREQGIRTRIDIYHINDAREEARCGSCREKIGKREGWTIGGACPKCGTRFNAIIVRS